MSTLYHTEGGFTPSGSAITPQKALKTLRQDMQQVLVDLEYKRAIADRHIFQYLRQEAYYRSSIEAQTQLIKDLDSLLHG